MTAKTALGKGLPSPGTAGVYSGVNLGLREHSPEEEIEHGLHAIVKDTEVWNILGRGNGILGQDALLSNLVAVVKSISYLARQEFSILLRVLVVPPMNRDLRFGF